MNVETKEESITCDLLSRQRTVIMGLAILSVIFFHFTEDCMKYKMYDEGLIKWYWTYVKSSGVDIFLFLSGLSLYYAMKKNGDVIRFYKRRMVRILIPYALVAVPTWLMVCMIIKNEGLREVIENLIFVTFFTKGTKLFWYIGMILVCYLIFPLIFVLIEKCNQRVLQWGGCILLCVLITYIAYSLRMTNRELYKNIEIALLRFPPFLMGCVYGRVSYAKRHGYWLWGVIAVISIVMSGPMLALESSFCDRYILAIVNISVFACLAVLLDMLQKDHWLVKFISWFGIRSLELYLCHVLVRRIMNLKGYATCYVRNETIMLAVSIACAWLLHKVTTEVKWNQLWKSILKK